MYFYTTPHALRYDEGLTVETSAFNLLGRPIYNFNLVDITKLRV